MATTPRRDVARDLGLPYDGGAASRSADAARRPLDGDDIRVRVTPGGHLADGMVIDASIVARLLGLRLLTLDARLRFAPAQFRDARRSGIGKQLRDARRSGIGEPFPAAGPPGRAWPPPGGLDEATDLLADASRTLGRVRQDLSASLRPSHSEQARPQAG